MEKMKQADSGSFRAVVVDLRVCASISRRKRRKDPFSHGQTSSGATVVLTIMQNDAPTCAEHQGVGRRKGRGIKCFALTSAVARRAAIGF